MTYCIICDSELYDDRSDEFECICCTELICETCIQVCEYCDNYICENCCTHDTYCYECSELIKILRNSEIKKIIEELNQKYFNCDDISHIIEEYALLR